MYAHTRNNTSIALRHIAAWASTAMLLSGMCVACVNEDVTERDDSNRGDSPVAFDTYLRNTDASATRAANPSLTGTLDSDKLRASKSGFGVFATYTETNKFANDDDNSGKKPFNFMFNEQVTWNATSGYWQYSPVKYWPNNNTPADLMGATGTKLHDYVSFFAYAPWTHDGADDHGILAVTTNTTNAAKSFLTYRLVESRKETEFVDLLWAQQRDRYKTDGLDGTTDGGGLVNGNVRFVFQHALSKLGVTVEAVPDHRHPDTDEDYPLYPEVLDENTKIFVERITINGKSFARQADMYLTPHPDTDNQPYWQNLSGSTPLTYTDKDLNYQVRYQKFTPDGDAEEYLKKTLPTGVTTTPQQVTSDDANPCALIIPYGEKERLTVTVTYHVITYDPSLTLNTPKFFSVVKNEGITATQTVTFHPNKIYTLRLLLGLTTVKFEVHSVDDWALPIVFGAEVKDMYEKETEYTIE